MKRIVLDLASCILDKVKIIYAIPFPFSLPLLPLLPLHIKTSNKKRTSRTTYLAMMELVGARGVFPSVGEVDRWNIQVNGVRDWATV